MTWDRARRILSDDYEAARAVVALARGEDGDHAFAGALLVVRMARVMGVERG